MDNFVSVLNEDFLFTLNAAISIAEKKIIYLINIQTQQVEPTMNHTTTPSDKATKAKKLRRKKVF